MFEDISFSYILNTFVFPFLRLSAVIVAGIILAMIVSKLINKILGKSGVDISLTKFLARCAKIAIIVIAIISALSLLGIPTTGLIAGVSAVAAAIALALQGSLSNIAGGIFLLITRPFVTNDVVEINGTTGSVKEIQLIHTILLTFDNREVIMPNSIVVNSTVTNLSNQETRRVDFLFSIGYDCDAKLAEELILKTLLKHELTITEPNAPFVRESAHSSSSIDITARVWCLAANYWTVYFDVLEQVRTEFNANGITIPYNQLDVHVSNK